MASSDEALMEGIMTLAPQLLTTMEAFEQVQRNLHPTRLDQLAEFIQPFEASLESVFTPFETLEFPEHIAKFGELLKEATIYSLRACDGITNANGDTMATALGSVKVSADEPQQ